MFRDRDLVRAFAAPPWNNVTRLPYNRNVAVGARGVIMPISWEGVRACAMIASPLLSVFDDFINGGAAILLLGVSTTSPSAANPSFNLLELAGCPIRTHGSSFIPGQRLTGIRGRGERDSRGYFVWRDTGPWPFSEAYNHAAQGAHVLLGELHAMEHIT
jgi:hypothetical protein